MGNIMQCIKYKLLLTLEELLFKEEEKLCLKSIHFLSSLPSVWVKDYIKASNHHYHQLSVTRNFFQFTISIKSEVRSRLIKS